MDYYILRSRQHNFVKVTKLLIDAVSKVEEVRWLTLL